MKVALSNDDGRCDTAFSGGNSYVEPGRCDHQQTAAVLVARRVMPLHGIIDAKDVRIFRHVLLLLFQKGYGRLRVIRHGVLIVIQM